MSRHELARAYPRLKREWPGLVMRQQGLRTAGLPDFILVWRGSVIFAEVKWEGHRLEALQAYKLDELTAHGALTVELIAGEAGWACWGPPHRIRQKTADAPDLLIPKIEETGASELLKVLNEATRSVVNGKFPT